MPITSEVNSQRSNTLNHNESKMTNGNNGIIIALKCGLIANCYCSRHQTIAMLYYSVNNSATGQN